MFQICIALRGEFAHTVMLFAMRVLSRIMYLKCFNDYASDKRRCDSIE